MTYLYFFEQNNCLIIAKMPHDYAYIPYSKKSTDSNMNFKKISKKIKPSVDHFPSHESEPPFSVPAQRKILGIHCIFPLILYISMHFSFDKMGRLTFLKIGEILPNSDRRPQPVTVPIRPINSSLPSGKQIGMTLG